MLVIEWALKWAVHGPSLDYPVAIRSKTGPTSP